MFTVRIARAVFTAAAVIALMSFAHALRPGTSEISLASGSLPMQAFVAGRLIAPQDVDDADDSTAEDEQQQEEQDDAQQVQQQNDADNEQALINSEQQAEEQNEEAQQQATQDMVQAVESDPQVIQNAQQG